MKGKSILLALNGSQQSRFAAEACWNLAKKLEAHVTAQHVVDSHSAWDFLGHEKPGFLVADDYLFAYKELVASMFDISERLADAYADEFETQGIDGEFVVDQGNPITEICRRAANYKLVVIGHRSYISRRQSRMHNLSVAEELAHDCPRPLLVVQGVCKEWSSLSIVISPDHINEVFINSCIDMAESLKLPAVLLCLTGGVHEEEPASLIADLRASNSRLADLHIALIPAQQNLNTSITNWSIPENAPFDENLWSNPLMTIPTRMIGGERLTVFDSSPSKFVSRLNLPSILMWPEEYAYARELEARSLSKAK